MKNLHVIPTPNPSRLLMSKRGHLQFLKDNASLNPNNHFEGVYQNIYITNDEDIKEGDWYINNGNLLKCTEIKKRSSCKKIILTTDQDLIKDGVQAIDDEFLEWFVKNPSCEVVDVVKDYNYGNLEHFDYKIIIPKEESKLELINDNIEEFDKAIKLFEIETTIEEYFLDNIKNVLQFGNDVQAIRFMEKYYQAKKEEDERKY